VKPEEKGPYICCEKIGLFEESSQHQKLKFTDNNDDFLSNLYISISSVISLK